MKKEVFSFASAHAGKEIHAVCYRPSNTSEIKGLVQIIHGFSEHIGRYDSFMTLLANKGYIVFIQHANKYKSTSLLYFRS